MEVSIRKSFKTQMNYGRSSQNQEELADLLSREATCLLIYLRPGFGKSMIFQCLPTPWFDCYCCDFASVIPDEGPGTISEQSE